MLGDKHRAWLADSPRCRLRGWDMERFDDDLRAAMGLLNDSFTTNYGFVPLSDPEVAFFAAPDEAPRAARSSPSSSSSPASRWGWGWSSPTSTSSSAG